jgi:hypothetical protein
MVPSPVSNTAAKFFKDASFLCFPITLTAFFQYTIELFLNFPPPFLYSRNEVLFMRDTKVASNIRVLEWLVVKVKKWLKYLDVLLNLREPMHRCVPGLEDNFYNNKKLGSKTKVMDG